MIQIELESVGAGNVAAHQLPHALHRKLEVFNVGYLRAFGTGSSDTTGTEQAHGVHITIAEIVFHGRT